ncbi:aldo/keto reductase [Desulfotomaculum defluvii]
MQYRTLGRTGLEVSVIGFGGIPIQRVTEQEAVTLVNRALDLGINFFDTARGYTDSEAKLGLVLKQRRKEAILATKSMARTKDGMTADIQKSLTTMGVDYIDLYQCHNVKDHESLEQILSPNGALVALKEAQSKGLIGHIGITGHVQETLVEALKTGKFATVQFPFNAVETEAKELLAMAQQTNTAIIVMKPMAGGALRNARLALGYLLEQPVTTIIPGVDSLQQIEENAQLGNEFTPLREEERIALKEETEKLGPVFCRRCEYCKPCPQGIDIPTVFLLEGYYNRYDLKDWAKERYKALEAKADMCIECGQCEEKCPYSLPIRKLLSEAGGILAE